MLSLARDVVPQPKLTTGSAVETQDCRLMVELKLEYGPIFFSREADKTDQFFQNLF